MEIMLLYAIAIHEAKLYLMCRSGSVFYSDRLGRELFPIQFPPKALLRVFHFTQTSGETGKSTSAYLNPIHVSSILIQLTFKSTKSLETTGLFCTSIHEYVCLDDNCKAGNMAHGFEDIQKHKTITKTQAISLAFVEIHTLL